jgi:hypothetical protein
MLRASSTASPLASRLRYLAPRLTLFVMVVGFSGAGQIAGCDTSKGSCLDLAATCGALCYLSGDVATDIARDKRRQAELDEKCGGCPEGQGCNLLENPPVCAKQSTYQDKPSPSVYIGGKGAACGKHEESGREYLCSKDFFCEESGSPRRCAERLPKGAACTGVGQCGLNFYCDKASKTCSSHREKGEACNWDHDFDICAAPFRCGRSSSRCMELRKPGEACGAADPEGILCAENLFCSRSGKCFAYRKAGEECDYNDKLCGGGLDCRSSENPRRCR